MRILFVSPEFHVKGFKPIGISTLSSVLKKEGHQTDIFDSSIYDLGERYKSQPEKIILFKPIKEPRKFPFPPLRDVKEAFAEKIKEFRPDLIAVSVSYFPFLLYKNVLSKCVPSEIPVIIGGVHPTTNAEEVISHDFVKMLCIGEGEYPLLELVKSMELGKVDKNIKNIWFKEKGKIIKNPLRPLIENLDELPFVDWSIYPPCFFEKPYEGNWWMGGDLMSSRGCYNRCSYCFNASYFDIYKTRNCVRFMSAERFIEELRYVALEYKVNLIKIRDSDFFNRPEDSIAKMAALYQKDSRLPYLIFNGYPHSIAKEKVALVKRMKCLSIGLGLETGNNEIRLKYLKRPMSEKKFLEAVKIIKDYGIRITSFNMMGMPTETREMVHQTIALNKKTKVDLADMSIMFPFPGTEMYDICQSKGYIPNDFEKIPYFRNEAVLNMPQFSREEMNGMVKVFQFYMFFPKFFYPLIKRAEKEDKLGLALYNIILKFFNFAHHYLDFPGKKRWIKNLFLSKKLAQEKI